MPPPSNRKLVDTVRRRLTGRGPRSESAALALLPPLDEGREYLIIGPNCWGRGKTAAEALKIAKRNRPTAGIGPGWKWIAHDVPAGAWLDDMGFNIHWKIPEGTNPLPSRVIGRWNVKEENERWP